MSGIVLTPCSCIHYEKGNYTSIASCGVVIPKKGKEAVLHELHCGHPGITRMKALARMYAWWPGIDKDIENMVQKCNECQVNQATPSVCSAAAPLEMAHKALV